MKIIIDSEKDSLVKKVHLNIDNTYIKICDFSNISSISIVEKEGEVFIDSVSKEDIPFSDVEEVKSSISDEVEKIDPILDEVPESILVEEDDDIVSSFDERLFQKLVDLRRGIAKESGIPPYYVFHDKSLKEMATVIPCDFKEMINITGVGDAKLEKYGSLFIESIQKYLDEFS